MTYKYWETCAERERGTENASVPGSAESTPIMSAEHAVSADAETLERTEFALSEDTAGTESDTPVPETEIVDLQEIRRDREDNDRMNREVEEFFAEEDGRSFAEGGETKKKSISRMIFVDGLLGVPLLVIAYIVTAAFLLAFAALTAVFFVAGIAMLMGAVIVICNSFKIFSVNVPTALVCIGASIAVIGLGLMMFLLCLLTAQKLIPFTVKLPVKLEKKLRLFKN